MITNVSFSLSPGSSCTIFKSNDVCQGKLPASLGAICPADPSRPHTLYRKSRTACSLARASADPSSLHLYE